MTQRRSARLGLVITCLSLSGCKEDPLLKAARSTQLDAVAQLVSPGNVNVQDATGHTPLMAAVSHGSLDIAKLLLEKGANPNLKNREGWTPLAYAVTVHVDLESKKLQEKDLEPDAAKALLSKGADVNARFKHFQDGERTILMQALASAESGKKDLLGGKTVMLLLDNGADLEARDSSGQTALFYAVRADEKELGLIELLLKKGANVNASNDDGETPLFFAVRLGKTEPVELLVRNKADTSIKNKKGKSVFDIAGEEGQKQVLAVLQAARY